MAIFWSCQKFDYLKKAVKSSLLGQSIFVVNRLKVPWLLMFALEWQQQGCHFPKR
jgi:hypothetical protein